MSEATERAALSEGFDHAIRERAAPCHVLSYRETGRQVYAGNGATFSSGRLNGHPVDTLYLTLERDGEPWTLHLRRDEAHVIVWLLAGALWSEEMGRMIDNGLEEDG